MKNYNFLLLLLSLHILPRIYDKKKRKAILFLHNKSKRKIPPFFSVAFNLTLTLPLIIDDNHNNKREKDCQQQSICDQFRFRHTTTNKVRQKMIVEERKKSIYSYSNISVKYELNWIECIISLYSMKIFLCKKKS